MTWLALTGLTVALLPSVGDAAVAPPCAAVIFVDQRTGYCAHPEYMEDPGIASTRVKQGFYVTRDGGRSWQRRAAAGLPAELGNHGGTMVLSPRYAQDRAVYIRVNGRMLRTVDDGASFTDPLAPVGGAEADGVTAIDSAALPGGVLPASLQHPVAFLVATDSFSSSDAGTVRPPIETFSPGTPDDDRRFVVPPNLSLHNQVFAISVRAAAGPGAGVVSACNVELACTPRFVFPAGEIVEQLTPVPDYPKTRTLFALTKTYAADRQSVRAWRSTDDGRTFAPMGSLDTHFRRAARSGVALFAGLAVSPADKRHVVARLAYVADEPSRTHPTEQIFRSDDGGTTWRRVSFGTGRATKVPGATIPWHGVAGTASLVHGRITMLRDGRLMVIAAPRIGEGVPWRLYCSTDGGVRWSSPCAR